MKINKTLILFAVLAIFSFSSCLNKEFDRPPSNCDSIDLKPTHSILGLKKLAKNFNLTDNINDTLRIKNDIIISGYVISSDLWGNQYKELVIQDDSAAIDILVDKSSLYQQFPIGAKVFVKCKNLYLGEAYKVVKLGVPFIDGNIIKIGRINGADSVFNKFFVRTCDSKLIQPYKTKIANLTDSLLYMLIQLDSIQFVPTDTNSTWSEITATTNRTLIDNKGKTIIVRTSNYASFARNPLPKGSGSIVGILGKYNADYQLYIRNLDDVNMKNPRF